jgi:hypothetical protein
MSRQMFADIFSLIARLRALPVPRMRGPTGSNGASDDSGGALDAVGAAGSGRQCGQPAALNAICARRVPLPIARVVQKEDPDLEPAGNLANVG